MDAITVVFKTTLKTYRGDAFDAGTVVDSNSPVLRDGLKISRRFFVHDSVSTLLDFVESTVELCQLVQTVREKSLQTWIHRIHRYPKVKIPAIAASNSNAEDLSFAEAELKLGGSGLESSAAPSLSQLSSLSPSPLESQALQESPSIQYFDFFDPKNPLVDVTVMIPFPRTALYRRKLLSVKSQGNIDEDKKKEEVEVGSLKSVGICSNCILLLSVVVHD